jgi:predicted RNase H-like HicB family nuclease
MSKAYPAKVEIQADGKYLVTFIDLHDTFTEGNPRQEALENAAEVLSAMLAWHADANKPAPLPTQGLLNVDYIDNSPPSS